MNFRDIINHQQFNLPYNPSGGSLIPNRENFAPRTNIEKNRFVYTNPNSCYYNNYSRRTSKDFTNGVSVIFLFKL